MGISCGSNRMQRSICSVVVLLVAGYLLTVPGIAESATSPGAAVSKIEIEGLAPFQVSFNFQNDSSKKLLNVYGKVVLINQFGNLVQQFAVEPFSVILGDSCLVKAASRWGFQEPGIYLLQVTLDASLDTLISNSFAFRIVPISLPLEPPQYLEGEGLYTVSQQPVNWGISRIGAPQAWQTTHGSEQVVVALIDSGVDYSVPELAQSMWVNKDEIPDNGIDDDGNGYIDDIHGWDFRDDDNSPFTGTRLHWHGTFIASIIAARPGKNAIVGVAPGAKIMDIRFLDSENSFRKQDCETFAQAVNYAVDNGASIINLSIYSDDKPCAVLEQALQRADEKGVIVIAIAGNDGTSEVSYPARYDFVTAVSAINDSDRLAEFSNYGSEIVFTGPGEMITSLIPGGFLATKSGTSFAAPFVSGTLALILSANQHMTGAQAIALLKESATDLGTAGHDNYFGYGLVNADAAVSK